MHDVRLIDLNTGIFSGEYIFQRAQKHGCGQRKPEAARSVKFPDFGTAAECYEVSTEVSTEV